MTLEVTAKQAAKRPKNTAHGASRGEVKQEEPKPRRGERKSYNAAFQNARRPSSEPGGQNCCPEASERERSGGTLCQDHNEPIQYLPHNLPAQLHQPKN